MAGQYQVFSAILVIVQVVLAPLLIGLIVGLASASVRRTIIVAAISASALVFVGVALIDALTRLRGPIGSINAEFYSLPGALALTLFELVLNAGLSLSFAAVILGLRETARLRRWGWFWAFLLTQMVAAVGSTLFYLTYASAFFGQRVFEHLYRGDLAFTAPYYLLASLLLVAAPFAALLFTSLGVPGAEPATPNGTAQPSPIPVVAPPTIPQPAQPYTPYPQNQ
jgi:hypothetical protein